MSRLSPIKGFGRMFGKPGLVEFGKSFIKVGVVSVVVVLVLWNDYFASLNAMLCSDPSAIFADPGKRSPKKIIVIIVFATAVIAVLDFAWTRHHWFSELKMTKQEVKEENKQAQGDPIVKSRLRSIQRDRARKRMIAAGSARHS